MEKVQWSADALPENIQMAQLMYSMRAADVNGEMLDSVMAYDMRDPEAESMPMLDAMVIEVNRMSMHMDKLMRVMNAAGEAVQVTEHIIGDPVKLRGTMQVPVQFVMSDGQAVTIWFHNPDATPDKLTPMDLLVSWRWLLNKRDVTIVVAPENGKDLNPREVGRRIMRLVARNSAAFLKANDKAAARMAEESAIDTEISELTTELDDLSRRIELARIESDAAAAAAAEEAARKAAEPFEVKVNRELSAIGWEVHGDGAKALMAYEIDGVELEGPPYEGKRTLAASWRGGSLVCNLGFEDLFSLSPQGATEAAEFANAFQAKVTEWESRKRAAVAEAKAAAAAAEAAAIGAVQPDSKHERAVARIEAIRDLLIQEHGFRPGKPAEGRRGISYELSGKHSALDVTLYEESAEAEGFMVTVDGFEREPDYQAFSPERTNEQIADSLAEFDFEEAFADYDDEDGLGDTIDLLGSPLHGMPLAFGRACMMLERGANAAGVSVHYGDFNESISASLLDSVTGETSVIGITAQLHQGGRVIARASVSRGGEISILDGQSGSEIVAKPSNASAVASVLTTLSTVAPAPAPQEQKEKSEVAQVFSAKGAANSGAIRSDDPLALEKLTAKLAALESYAALMRKTNRLVRKGDDEALKAMGYSDKMIEGFKKPDFAGRIGFPDYEMSNNNGEMGRLKKRIKLLTPTPTPTPTPEPEAAPVAATEPPVGRYKYAVASRPIGIGTNTPDGMVSLLSRPKDGEFGYLDARHGIATYDRQLTAQEVKAAEWRPMIESNEAFREIVRKFVESQGEYVPKYAEFASKNGDEDAWRAMRVEFLSEITANFGATPLFSLNVQEEAVIAMEIVREIAGKQPKLLSVEVQEPVTEVQEPVTEVQANPDEAADRAYLNTLIDGTGDLLASETFERLEPMFEKYAEGSDMYALLEKASVVVGNAAVSAAQAALATQ